MVLRLPKPDRPLADGVQQRKVLSGARSAPAFESLTALRARA
jgi:hypothetical protein